LLVFYVIVIETTTQAGAQQLYQVLIIYVVARKARVLVTMIERAASYIKSYIFAPY